MTYQQLYPRGRASALTAGTDYELVARLRAARANGDEALTAVERYDPDFSLKLEGCKTVDAAETLLADWLQRRVGVLTQTQDHLRQMWQEAHVQRSTAAQETGDV